MPPKSKRPATNEDLFNFFTEINIIAQLSGNLFERQLPEGMTNSQFSVLNWFLRVDDEATPGRLATAFQVTPGAMTNTLKRLETKGLIKVEPDSSSGRKKRVTITRQGRNMHKKCLAAATSLLKEFESAFPPGSVGALTRKLAIIREYIDEYRYR